MVAGTEPPGSPGRSISTAPRKGTARSPTKTRPGDKEPPSGARAGQAAPRSGHSAWRGPGWRPPVTSNRPPGAAAGPSRGQGGSWARPEESCHPPSPPTTLGGEDRGRPTRQASSSVCPPVGEGKGQSVTTTLIPPRSGPDSSTHSAGGKERASQRAPRPRRCRPALRPPPRASIGRWRRSHVGRRRALHWRLSGRRG